MTAYNDLAGLVTFRPLGPDVARAGARAYSQFRAPWTSTVRLLARELRVLDATRVVLEVDLREGQIRVDGLPRADARAGSPIVVLSMNVPPPIGYLRYEARAFTDWQDNVRAIALGLEALRAIDRYGFTKKGEQYAGFRALPAGTPGGDVGRGRELIAKYGSIAAARRATHPDHGGQDADFRAVQAAIEAG